MVLNFHDAVLYQSDLEILKSNAWLNDACIHFCLTKLSHDLDWPASKTCRFIDPSVLSFFMHQWDEEEDGNEDVLGLKMAKKNQSQLAVFLPINDNYVSNRWTTPGGGNHWSLLLLVASYVESDSPSLAQFLHFDSSAGSNQQAAQAVAQKIQRTLVNWQQADKKKTVNSKVLIFQECSAPQQQNGYDCGIHTLGTAQALAQSITSRAADFSYQTKQLEDDVKASVAASPCFCSKLRQRIAKDAEELASRS